MMTPLTSCRSFPCDDAQDIARYLDYARKSCLNQTQSSLAIPLAGRDPTTPSLSQSTNL